MIYILAGAALIAVLVWAGRGGLRGMDPGGVRVSAGVISVLCLLAAAVLAPRVWPVSLILLLVAIGSAVAARRAPRGRARPLDPGMEEARSILGVGANATEDEIQEAYTRLMRMAHPDAGGTSGLAAQLNAARDKLLRR